MPSWIKRALGLKPPKSGKYAPKPGEWGFLHSVGSFDPMPDRVLLWTRLTPPPALVEKHGLEGVAMEVSWEVSEAEDFGALAEPAQNAKRTYGAASRSAPASSPTSGRSGSSPPGSRTRCTRPTPTRCASPTCTSAG